MHDKEGLPFVIHSSLASLKHVRSLTRTIIKWYAEFVFPFSTLHILWPSYDEHLDDESDRSYPCRQHFILYHSCLTEYMHILSHSCSIIALC